MSRPTTSSGDPAEALLALEQRHADLDFDELRRSILAREPGAWRRFVERYSRFVYTVARRLSGGQDDEENAQQVYAAVFERLCSDGFRLLREFRGESRFETYLFTAIRNAVVHQRRRATHQRGRSEPYDETLQLERPGAGEEADFSTSIGLDPQKVAGLLAESLARLEPREREVLQARFQGGLTQRRLAGAFRWKDTNAAAYEVCRILRKLDLLSRCRRTLRWGEPEHEVLRHQLRSWLEEAP